MIKTIRINEQPVEINTSAGWTFVYRETFGRDILGELMPILEAIVVAIPQMAEVDGEDVDISTATLVRGLQDGTLLDSIAVLSTLEFTTVLQIFWALAKNADKSIPNVDEWVNQFEILPLDEVLPELLLAIAGGLTSSKNLERLTALMTKTTKEESPSTESSSEQSAAG